MIKVSVERVFLAIIWGIIFISITGCSYYLSKDRLYSHERGSIQRLSSFKYIYIDANKRDYNFPSRIDLAKSFRKQNYFRIISELPTDEKLLALTLVINSKVSFAKFWELNLDPLAEVNGDPNKLESILLTAKIKADDDSLYPSIVSNSLLKLRFKLSSAKDGIILLDTEKSLAFQQIYQGKEVVKDRPDGQQEFDRLVKLGFDRFAYQLNFNKKEEFIHLEAGLANSFIRKMIPFLNGEPTIMKGIRLAQGKNWLNALTTWLIVTYEPLEGVSDKTFLKNRASAFYNMGQVYAYHNLWESAVLMFSYANQSDSKVHYAQAWSDSVTAWKEYDYTRLMETDLIKLDKDILSLDPIERLKLLEFVPALKRDTLWPGADFLRIN
ncbi:MAG: hypothetical protein JJV97_03380 [SAR324 cluster bacterium]|nr:hypothetical protein [SAR324 cluster bacterium]